MTRRTFLMAAAAARQTREIAITMDDVAWQAIPEPFTARANTTLLQTLRHHGVHAALFAAGKNVDNQKGAEILKSWNDEGHTIGNHTYSHRNYDSVSFEDFSTDVLRGEQFVKGLSRYTRYFRFPLLKEGNTAAKRDAMRNFMRERGFSNGSVTVDASDWYYDQRLRERLKTDPSFEVARFRQPYLDHLLDRADYYDGLARQTLGRSPKHTLLVHYNLINVLFLGNAMDAFRRRGWKWVSAEDAFRDPVFRMAPKTVPAGESLVWALAKESGRFEGKLRYPGEDGDYEKIKVDNI